ncbi:MAG: hypothetical protein GSR81_01700 [Desulfurococcales archaeon]|nr:hypothetical protein [Desulfurococcales archaeon]
MADKTMARICPRCGRSSDEIEFIGSLCKDCYVETVGIARVPEEISFTYCRYCGRYKYQGGWNEPSGSIEDTLIDYLVLVLSRKAKPSREINEVWINSVKLDRPFMGPGLYKALVEIGGRHNETTVIEERVITVRVNMAVCPLCTNRITKRGYEAIVQIRGSSGKLSEDLRKRIDDFIEEELVGVLRESIIDLEEKKEGFDLLINDSSAARIIASKIKSAFMGKTIETYKLIGRKPDGSRKGRLTISVRLPDIVPGNILKIGDKLFLFLEVSRRGNPILVDLQSGTEITANPEFLWKKGFTHYESGMEYRKLMLISRGNSITFLDASTGYSQVLDFPRDRVHVYVEDFEPGRIFKVLIVRGRAYVLGYEDNEINSR